MSGKRYQGIAEASILLAISLFLATAAFADGGEPPVGIMVSLEQAKQDIAAMREAGFGVAKTTLTYEFAGNLSREPGKEAILRELVDQISTARRLAFETKALLDQVDEGMRKAEDDGLRIPATKDTYTLAWSAFRREDYTTAYNRASQAALSLLLETKGEVNVAVFLKRNLWYAIPIFLYVSYLLYLLYNRIVYSRGDQIFDDLLKEEQTIKPLLEHIEAEYFKKRTISKADYHKAMHQYRKRLAQIKRLKGEVKSKMLQYGEREDLVRRLKQEHDYLLKTIKDMQKHHFVAQDLDKARYQGQARELSNRLIDVEILIAILYRMEEEERQPKTEASAWDKLLKRFPQGGNGR